jgi:hypothetical protein
MCAFCEVLTAALVRVVVANIATAEEHASSIVTISSDSESWDFSTTSKIFPGGLYTYFLMFCISYYIYQRPFLQGFLTKSSSVCEKKRYAPKRYLYVPIFSSGPDAVPLSYCHPMGLIITSFESSIQNGANFSSYIPTLEDGGTMFLQNISLQYHTVTIKAININIGACH